MMFASKPLPQSKVSFIIEPQVRFIENNLVSKKKGRKSPKMAKQIFEIFDGQKLTDDMLDEASDLFNKNYGIWGEDLNRKAPTGFPKKGKSRLTNYLF